MLGNFVYYNPTVLYFGRGALSALALELPNYGPKVQLIYGGGSIKKNGIYDQVTALLRETGKEIVEDPGVMPNPATDKLYEGCWRDNLHSIWAGQELYRPGNTREIFSSILQSNMRPVYDSARRQGYEIWKVM